MARFLKRHSTVPTALHDALLVFLAQSGEHVISPGEIQIRLFHVWQMTFRVWPIVRYHSEACRFSKKSGKWVLSDALMTSITISLAGSRSCRSYHQLPRLSWLVVSAMGPGIPPAVRVWTGMMVRFGSIPVQKPDPHLLGRPNPQPYLSTRGFCRVWLDPSVPISSSHFCVFLYMVAFRYPTVMCKILTLVHHCLCSFYWLPL